MTPPSRLIVGPFNRVEGDLELALDIADGTVREARVTAPMFRGFEALLIGRPPEDALVVAPRICGICSISQSVAAARALADAGGQTMPANGRLVTNLVLAAENATDHLTHFILFFMPDFARIAYSGRWWWDLARTRFAATTGEAARMFVPARARFLHLMGLLAGKWPHSLALRPGGVTKGVDTSEKVRLLGVLADFRAVLEAMLFADRLENVTRLDSVAALDHWADARPADQGDFRLFLHIARDLALDRLGQGPDHFLSHGGFDLWPAGVRRDGQLMTPTARSIVEDLTSTWMAGPNRPDVDKAGAYSWCKAPRLDGRPAEVGALARQVVAGDPLALALAAGGGDVRARIVMRMVELARLVIAMEGWARDIVPGQPFCAPPVAAPSTCGQGAGLVEAARGALGHWLTIDNGVISDYRIIAPTTWNFSPRDGTGVPGPLEGALAGTPVEAGEAVPLAVQHVVRSFDPCMACTVH